MLYGSVELRGCRGSGGLDKEVYEEGGEEEVRELNAGAICLERLMTPLGGLASGRQAHQMLLVLPQCRFACEVVISFKFATAGIVYGIGRIERFLAIHAKCQGSHWQGTAC